MKNANGVSRLTLRACSMICLASKTMVVSVMTWLIPAHSCESSVQRTRIVILGPAVHYSKRCRFCTVLFCYHGFTMRQTSVP